MPTVMQQEGRHRLAGTLVVIAALLCLAVAGLVTKSFWILCILAGSIGGMIHDIVQNKGVILYPHSTEEGVYLGLGIGFLLGAVSVFLASATVSSVPTTISPGDFITPLTYGLGLKGVVDAGGNAALGRLTAT